MKEICPEWLGVCHTFVTLRTSNRNKPDEYCQQATAGAESPTAAMMQRHFDQDLDALREKLLTMASHASSSVVNALKALVERDDDLARRVKQDAADEGSR